jgi:hypothetical protein
MMKLLYVQVWWWIDLVRSEDMITQPTANKVGITAGTGGEHKHMGV